MRILIGAVLAVLVGCSSPQAPAWGHLTVTQRHGVEVLRDGSGAMAMVDWRGAVLCAWSLQVAAQDIGKRCFAGKDAEFQQELARSISRTEDFIVANSSAPTSHADLAAFKRAERLRAGDDLKPQKLCKSEWVQLYENFRAQGVAGLRAATDELLSAPREPVMNPCI